MPVLVATALLLSATPAQAAFPGENGKIAFASGGNIETIGPDGTGRTALTTGTSPAWSADGARLAFADSRPGVSEIAAVNPDGSGRTTITQTCGASCKVFYGIPNWSPDGTQLTINSTVCGSSECGTSLLIVTAAGATVRGLGAGGSGDWSPDGSTIALDRTADFGPPICEGPFFCNSEIYTVGADGSGLVRLTSDPANDFSPSWSPDGRQIAFASGRDGNGEIYVMNADGTGQTRITHHPASDGSPAWSPDGSKIAFVSTRDGNFELYVMNADGTGLTNLTSSPGVEEFAPDWQPLSGRPPDCSGVTATPSSLRHHGFRTVTLSGATDPDGDAVTIAITGVTQDEPVGRRPDARPGASADQVELRAQRRPRGDGRVYRIGFTATDGTDECSGVASVEVRRHKNRPAVDSAPPSYDSFGP